MKCYFALSDDVSNNDIYYWMFVATINSARKNTNLDLHCLFDFRKKYVDNIEQDRIYKLLKEKNVTVHLCSIDFENELLSVYSEDYLKSINVTKSSLYSRFLRFMIADIEKTDKIVLYADTDILFLKNIDDSIINTETVAVCPEFDKKKNFSYFNAGIMLLNMESYRLAKKNLISILKQNKHPTIECCDQGYLNDIYRKNFDRLPLEYNWKPYWGENGNAIIVHLHGFKPKLDCSGTENTYCDWISHTLSMNKDSKKGCIHYFSEFVKYTENQSLYLPVMTNLLCMLECQKYDVLTFKNRLIRKIRKVVKRSKK